MVICISTMGKVLVNKLLAITNQQINFIIVDNKKNLSQIENQKLSGISDILLSKLMDREIMTL